MFLAVKVALWLQDTSAPGAGEPAGGSPHNCLRCRQLHAARHKRLNGSLTSSLTGSMNGCCLLRDVANWRHRGQRIAASSHTGSVRLQGNLSFRFRPLYHART